MLCTRAVHAACSQRLAPPGLYACCSQVWLIYGGITQDIYVIAANLPGLWLGLYMTVCGKG